MCQPWEDWRRAVFILGLQGEGQLSRVNSVMSYSQGPERWGRRDPWFQERGSGRFSSLLSSLPCFCLASLQFCPRFANMVLVTESVQKLALRLAQLLRQEVAKTTCWGWAGAWKRCRRGSWPWRAQAPLVQQDGFASHSECVCLSDFIKGLTVKLSQPPSDQKQAATKDLFPPLLAKTCCVSLHCLNVLKLIWLSVCRVINELIGNLVGHLYFFLMFRYPMDLGGRNFLSTPQFL